MRSNYCSNVSRRTRQRRHRGRVNNTRGVAIQRVQRRSSKRCVAQRHSLATKASDPSRGQRGVHVRSRTRQRRHCGRVDRTSGVAIQRVQRRSRKRRVAQRHSLATKTSDPSRDQRGVHVRSRTRQRRHCGRVDNTGGVAIQRVQRRSSKRRVTQRHSLIAKAGDTSRGQRGVHIRSSTRDCRHRGRIDRAGGVAIKCVQRRSRKRCVAQRHSLATKAGDTSRGQRGVHV